MSGETQGGTHRQIGHFLVIGGLTVVLDLAAYSILLRLGFPVGTAKAIGFIAGTAFAYFANRIVTFENAGGGTTTMMRFAAVYSVNLIVNVAVNSLILAVAGRTDAALALAFLVATGTSATLNFLGMKYWVFSSPAPGMRS